MPSRRAIGRRLALLCALAGPVILPMVASAGPQAPNIYALLSEANALQGQQKFAESIPILERAMAAARSTYPKDDPQIASVANMLAISLVSVPDAANQQRAEALLREALAVVRARPAECGMLTLQVPKNLADVLIQLAKVAEAVPLAEQLARDAEAKYPAGDQRTEMMRETLVKAYLVAGRPRDAITPARLVLKSVEARLGADHPDTIAPRVYLGRALGEIAAGQEAEALLEKAVAIAERSLPPDHKARELAVNSLAQLRIIQGRPVGGQGGAAGGAAGPAGSAMPVTNDPSLLNTWALQAIAEGRYAEAEAALQKALPLCEQQRGPEHPDTSAVVSTLAVLYTTWARYADAERYARRAIDSLQRNPGPGSVLEARTRLTLGSIYLMMNRLTDAEAELVRARQWLEDKMGPGDPDTQRAVNNLASLFFQLGRYREASDLLDAALARLRQRLPGDNEVVATMLSNVGQAYMGQGDLDLSERRLREAVDMFRRLGRASAEAAAAAGGLANVALMRGQTGDAERLYREAYENTRATRGPSHPDTCNVLDNLACYYACVGNGSAAADRYEESRRNRLAFLGRTLPGLADNDRIALIEQAERITRDMAASLGLALPSDPAIAARSAAWVVNSKGVAIRAQGEQAVLSRAATDPQTAQLVAQLRAVRSRLTQAESGASTTPAPPAGPAPTPGLAQQALELERQLALALPSVGSASRWVGLDAVRNALPPDAVLVEFLHLYKISYSTNLVQVAWQPAHYGAWVIPAAGRGDVRVVDLGPAAPIEAALSDALRAARIVAGRDEAAAEKKARQALAQLSAKLLEPLSNELEPAKRWLISPDGALWLVPWAALPTRDGRFAVEGHLIQLAVSGRDLVEPASTATPGAPAVVADPDYDRGGDAVAAKAAQVLGAEAQGGTRGPRPATDWGKVDRLAYSRPEAEAVAPAMTAYADAQARLFLDDAASETVVKGLKGPKALLISTHGFFAGGNDAAPSGSPFAASPTARPMVNQGARTSSPLLRCGLALAGYQSGRAAATGGGVIDDGLLTGLEILDADYRGTELVVLSACETALGEVRAGEGVAGLRQAFQLAGANGVVASLWKVPDEDTYRLMTGLFRALKDRGPAEALREAQLALIADRRARKGGAHPFYWAAFSLTGLPGRAFGADPVLPPGSPGLPALPVRGVLPAGDGLRVNPVTGRPHEPTFWVDLGLTLGLGLGGAFAGRRWWKLAGPAAP